MTRDPGDDPAFKPELLAPIIAALEGVVREELSIPAGTTVEIVTLIAIDGLCQVACNIPHEEAENLVAQFLYARENQETSGTVKVVVKTAGEDDE